MKIINVDLNQKFNRLTYLGKEIIKNKRRFLYCECICGKIGYYEMYKLNTGHTKSCGCYRDEIRVSSNITHGYSRRKSIDKSKKMTYKSWSGILTRTTCPTNKKYLRYGGRGIKVCKRWQGKKGFENFLADMGERPVGTSIDRIDNNGNYTKSNCRWATAKEQAQNTSRTRKITYKNQTKCIREWALILDMNETTLTQRINKNPLNIERAFTTPVRKLTRIYDPSNQHPLV
jgi:hypothetical protein